MLDNKGTVFKGKVEVDQDFVHGDKHTIEKLVVNIYGDQAAPVFSDEELQEQLVEYRRYISENYRYLDFKGIDGIADAVNGSAGIKLEVVYVPLRAREDTPDGESWHRLGGRFYCGAKAASHLTSEEMEHEFGKAEASALSVEQWLKDHPALVILGDPGSGKSTIVKRLALGFADQENAPLPILLPLNAYSQALEKEPCSFENFLPEYFHAKRSQLDKHKLKALFTGALQQEKAVILMDGLDEVGDNRGEVVTQVNNFVQAWVPDPEKGLTSGNRMITTSRFVGYRDYPLADPRWKTVALNDWNFEEIERFFEAFTGVSELAWVGGEQLEGSQVQASEEKKALMMVISNNVGIRRLSGNPLLASLLALIKRQGMILPDKRVELYKIYMETLLRSWNRGRNLDKKPIGPIIEFAPTQKLLAKLALHLREINPQGGLIREEAMRDYLLAYYLEDDYTRQEAGEQTKGFLRSVHQYSNLLIEKGHQQYGFIHLTFEEYLAGFGLALKEKDELCELFPEYLKSPERWKETLLLSLGVISIVNTRSEMANSILESLLKKDSPEHVLFVGEAINDVGSAVLGNKMTRKIQQALQNTMCDISIDVKLRAKAGRLLGELGDPRSGVTLTREGEYKDLPDIDWVVIPSGIFTMGTEGDEGYADEKPSHEVSLDTFKISRYPVTNAQYASFVNSGGYKDESLWLEPKAALNWLRGGKADLSLLDDNLDVKKNYEDYLAGEKTRSEPWFWEQRKWNNPNHPVVGVSWYEALAFCNWLSQTGQYEGNVRLPTEAEWEYAARGNGSLRYSWGNEVDSNKGNYKDTGLNQTSAVGMFGEGLAFGLCDTTGNVWEWTSSQWGGSLNAPDFTYEKWLEQEAQRDNLDKYSLRIIRGGSWYDATGDVRSAFRDGFHPISRDYFIGFRVVS